MGNTKHAMPEARTLAQAISALLIDLMLDGHLEPGQKLDEVKLCEEFGLSRTPLREALRSLASRGLVEYRPNQGSYVRDMGAQEALQLYQLREGLEGMAARLLAERVSDKQIDELRALAEIIAVGSLNPSRERTEADQRFHTLIAEWCGNPLIAEHVSAAKLLERTMVLTRRYVVAPPADASDHRRIVDALAARDPNAAEETMRATIRDAAERTSDVPNGH